MTYDNSDLNLAVAALDRKMARSNVKNPGLCVKVIRGLPLNRAEAAVWEEFRKRHSDEEVMVQVATVLVKKMPAQAELLNSAIHAVSVPAQTPFPPSRNNLRAHSTSFSSTKLTSVDVSGDCTDPASRRTQSSCTISTTSSPEAPKPKNILQEHAKNTKNGVFVRSFSMDSLRRDLRSCFSGVSTQHHKSKIPHKKEQHLTVRGGTARKILCDTPRSHSTTVCCSSLSADTYFLAKGGEGEVAKRVGVARWKPAGTLTASTSTGWRVTPSHA